MEELLARIKAHLRSDATPIAQEVVDTINNSLKKHKVNAHAVIGGSYAKGTFLPFDHDVDVFVRFADDKGCSDILEQVLAPFTPKRIHGSRDYFQFVTNEMSFEIVPTLAITKPEEAKNTTDVSYFHVEFVQQHTKKNPHLIDDIRLLKQFMKSAKVYGAESYMRGFSGHVVDLLSIHYHTFIDAIKNISTWRKPVVITSFSPSTNTVKLNDAKTHGPLTIIDPVQPNRNASAALHDECFKRLITRAKNFLEHPNVTYFEIVPLTLSEIHLRAAGKPFIAYEFYLTNQSKDVAGSKGRKAHEWLVYSASQAGFTITEEGYEVQGTTALGYIIADNDSLTDTMTLQGPPSTRPLDVSKFKDAHTTTYEKNGTWYATTPRRFTTLVDMFNKVRTDEMVTSRVLGAKRL